MWGGGGGGRSMALKEHQWETDSNLKCANIMLSNSHKHAVTAEHQRGC